MRKIIQSILFVLARTVLKRRRPLIVAVSGSVGKTTAKEAIYTVLKAQYHGAVRRTVMNLNTEIGVPLTVLGLSGGGRNPFLWFFRLLEGLRVAIWTSSYPEVLVLEMGADRPGDIRYLAHLAPPKIAVITAIGEIPSHVEFFAGPKTLAREKARLVESLPEDGWAVLNFDDLTVLEMRERTDGHILTYGFSEGAQVRASAYEIRVSNENGREIPEGVSFKIEHEGKFVPVRLANMFGKGAVYAALAGAAVGIALKMHLVEISEALADLEPLSGRMHLREGISGTLLLDDSYNASPHAMQEALETLRALPAKRRVVVLGDMLELGKYTEAAHRAAGGAMPDVADIFVAVGERMLFAADEAVARGMDGSRVHKFSRSQDAGRFVHDLVEKGDLVLVKGSRGMRMERVVNELVV